MSELSFSNTLNNNNEFSSNLFFILSNFCFSIFSHPLYFSYFLFFSPYILKLLSFLSPLFITTTLLLLVALLTFTPNLVHQKGISKTTSYELSESKFCFLLSTFQNFLAWFVYEVDEKDDEFGLVDELEAYLVMFQASIFETHEPKLVEDCSELSEEAFEEALEEAHEEECSSEVEEELNVKLDDEIENQVEKVDDHEVESIKPVSDVKRLVSLFQEYAELENVSCEKEEKEVKKTILLLNSKFNKVEESEKQWSIRSGSKVKSNRDMFGNKVRGNSDEEHALVAKVKVKKLESPQRNIKENDSGELCSTNLGSFGSMRVEKEWRRTLACKLFEERHNNSDGSEGMDMLWETYDEKESNKVVGMKKSNTKRGKKSEVECSEDEEEEEDEIGAKLCCLQALKFSTGKMNLGMGRPNLLKFSKALKGIGWLHHVGKNGKKNNH